MKLEWIDPKKAMPEYGEEVLAVVSGEHGGIRYDRDVMPAIWDGGVWYLDDGVVDDEETITVSAWMPYPVPPADLPPRMIDGQELLNRLILVSASAAQWSGPRAITEAIAELRRMMSD